MKENLREDLKMYLISDSDILLYKVIFFTFDIIIF